MSEDGEGPYDNSHCAFLQVFLSRSVLTFQEAKPILAAILTAHQNGEVLPEDISEADFNNYVSAANNAISEFDFEIRSTYSQHDRTRIYALVNTRSDPATQLATTHSADEISFLKRVLDAMFETNNTRRQELMAVSSMQAVRLHKSVGAGETQNGGATQGSAGQGITMGQAEKMLDNMADEGWFERSKAGYYSLSPRALMELKGWLLATYNEPADEDAEDSRGVERIKLCKACREIVTVGQRCPNLDCASRLHNICVQNFFTAQRTKKCPMCGTAWSGEDHVGEKAAKGVEKRRRTTGGTSRRATIQGDAEAESDG